MPHIAADLPEIIRDNSVYVIGELEDGEAIGWSWLPLVKRLHAKSWAIKSYGDFAELHYVLEQIAEETQASPLATLFFVTTGDRTGSVLIEKAFGIKVWFADELVLSDSTSWVAAVVRGTDVLSE